MWLTTAITALLLFCLCISVVAMQEVEALCDMLDFGGPAMVQCAKVKSMPTTLPTDTRFADDICHSCCCCCFLLSHF
jgi:hypothetical protein